MLQLLRMTMNVIHIRKCEDIGWCGTPRLLLNSSRSETIFFSLYANAIAEGGRNEINYFFFLHFSHLAAESMHAPPSSPTSRAAFPFAVLMRQKYKIQSLKTLNEEHHNANL